jgi:hypothetical protein
VHVPIASKSAFEVLQRETGSSRPALHFSSLLFCKSLSNIDLHQVIRSGDNHPAEQDQSCTALDNGYYISIAGAPQPNHAAGFVNSRFSTRSDHTAEESEDLRFLLLLRINLPASAELLALRDEQ